MIKNFLRFICRFRYPVSLPEEVALALGIELSNFYTFEDCMKRITSPSCCPSNLRKYMDRQKAEAAFANACRTDTFTHSSLFSYYFNEGWLEFELRFDEESRLRRLYVRHRDLPQEQGLELTLLERRSSEDALSPRDRDKRISCYVYKKIA